MPSGSRRRGWSSRLEKNDLISQIATSSLGAALRFQFGTSNPGLGGLTPPDASGRVGAMTKTPNAKALVPIESIAGHIYVIRDEKVMLDSDLAALYGVPTKVLNQAVTRNPKRFPDDFMFRLNTAEFKNLRSQIVTSSWGGRRKPPRAFTELGVAMLSSVLRSERAIEVNVAIMRTFVRIRRVLSANEDLARQLAKHDRKITALMEAVAGLLEAPEPEPEPKKNPIGYVRPGP